MTSFPLLQALQANGFGTNFHGAISESWIVFVAYAFVDDTDLIEAARFPSDTVVSREYEIIIIKFPS